MPDTTARNSRSIRQIPSLSLPDQPGSPQSIAKKPPRIHRPAELTFDAASSRLDDVAFLRLPDVKAITGLSKSSLYALIRENRFPAPVRLGARAVAWVRSEVKQWAAERVRASRSIA
jgi:prophage regulatory protein